MVEDELTMDTNEGDGDPAAPPHTPTVQERVKRYLETTKRKKSDCNGSGTKLILDSTYSAINNIRIHMLKSPNLNGKDSFSTPGFCGCFFDESDQRQELAHTRFVFDKKINATFSFNPSTMTCDSCPNAHPVLSEADHSSGVDVFILSDQCFPPVLPAATGNCVKIIRVENACLTELAEIFLSTVAGCAVQVGTLVTLSSGSRLCQIGVAAYAEELVRASKIIMASLSGKVRVRAGVPLLLQGTADPSLVRSIFELDGWLCSTRDSNDGFLHETFKATLLSIKNLGLGDSQVTPLFRFQLPVGLNSYEKKTFSSEGWDNLPYGTHPMDPANEKVVISTLLNELNNNFAANLSVNVDLSRSHTQRGSGNLAPADNYLVVGASLAGRLCAALEAGGHNAVHIKTVSWRPTPDTIKRTAQELADAIDVSPPATTVIFQFLDSAAFYARCDDGSLVPARQGLDDDGKPDHRFHLDGELVVAPKELFLHTLVKG